MKQTDSMLYGSVYDMYFILEKKIDERSCKPNYINVYLKSFKKPINTLMHEDEFCPRFYVYDNRPCLF